MRSTIKPVALILLLIILGSTETHALIGGKEARISSAVFIRENLCSGVLIAQNTILTAGHCIIKNLARAPLISQDQALTVEGFDGNDYNSGKQRFQVRVLSAEVHPSWRLALSKHHSADFAADDPESFDVGVLVIDQNIPNTPAHLPDENGSLPQAAYATGAGCAARGEKPSAQLKSSLIPLHQFAGTKIEMAPTDLNTGGTASICHGDSGGGLYYADKGENLQNPLQILGLNSVLKAAPTSDAIAAFAVDLRDKDLQAWIRQFISANSSAKSLAYAQDQLPQSFDEDLKSYMSFNGPRSIALRKIVAIALKDPLLNCYPQYIRSNIPSPELKTFAEAILDNQNTSVAASAIRDHLFAEGHLRPCPRQQKE